VSRRRNKADSRMDAIQDLTAAEGSVRAWYVGATGLESLLAIQVHANVVRALADLERVADAIKEAKNEAV
jgi:glycine cleavage system pyridoxal-binding protein P